MISDFFKHIVTYKVKIEEVPDWDFFRQLLLEFYPALSIKRLHKTIFDFINKLYIATKTRELNCLHIHLPYQSEKEELDLAIFITNALRFKEIKQGITTIKEKENSMYYFLNNTLEKPKSLNDYLSIHNSSLSGKSNVFNIVFKHDSIAQKSSDKGVRRVPSTLSGPQLKKRLAKENRQVEIEINNYKYLARVLEYYNSSHSFYGIKELNILPSIFFMCLKGMATKLENQPNELWNQYDIEKAITNKSAHNINELRPIVLNTKVNLTKIEDDEIYYNIHNKSIYFELARTIVLFNTLSRKNTFDGFNYSKVLEYAGAEEEYKSNIKRQLIVTYEKKKIFSFLDYSKKLNQVKTRYKVNVEDDTFQLMPFDFQDNGLGQIQFHSIEIESLLEAFYDKLHEVDEVAYNKYLSIWFFNLLSNIHNEKCKTFIWNLLIDKLDIGSNLSDFKTYYNLLANKIIEYNVRLLEEWKNIENLTIIIPNQFTELKDICKSISSDFLYNTSIASWKDLKKEFTSENRYLILDYKDSRFDHSLSPNILDLTISSPNVSFQYISTFFKKRFLKNSKSYLEKVVQPILLNKKRKKYFGIKENKIQNIISDLVDEIRNTGSIDDQFDDIDETNYEQQVGDNVKVYFGKKDISVAKSEKFLIKNTGDNNYLIKRADELDYNNKIEGQKLSELYMGFNLFEDNLTDKTEIEKFKTQLNLALDEDEWLWKELLKREAADGSFEELYAKIKNISVRDKFYLVSESTFRNTYLDPKNKALPREKRGTRSIFNYLNLPKAYYRLVIRFKARRVLKSRNSNYKMELLIESLVVNKLFPKYDPSKFSKWYKWITESKVIDLEDVGIFENIESEVEILTQLLIENIKLRKITKTEIVSND